MRAYPPLRASGGEVAPPGLPATSSPWTDLPEARRIVRFLTADPSMLREVRRPTGYARWLETGETRERAFEPATNAADRLLRRLWTLFDQHICSTIGSTVLYSEAFIAEMQHQPAVDDVIADAIADRRG